MNTNQKFVLTVLVFIISVVAYPQTERWIYRYSGGNVTIDDVAYCLVYGADGNLYAGGYTFHDSTNRDFTVISLTNSGSERWIYKFITLGNNWDVCNSVCYGNDGNIYAVGDCTGSDSALHFTIVSLTTDGSERWIYQYPAVSYAHAICYCSDGNIYAVGDDVQGRILVVSLDNNGNERWTYVYPTPSSESNPGRSITYGLDENIYVAGYTGPEWNTDVTVISLTLSGSERWVYFYNGPGGIYDYGECVVYGSDNNLYIFGSTCYLWGPGYVFSQGLVISLTTSGNERWTYISPDDPNGFYCGEYGADGNLYTAGAYGWDIPFFLVESISDLGTYRWNYIDTTWGYCTSIAYDSLGNIYACGMTSDSWQGGKSYFTIICFSESGALQWTYKKHWWGSFIANVANSIIFGFDRNIYAAGTISDSLNSNNFTVISLNSTGISEGEMSKIEGKGLSFLVFPNVFRDNAWIQYTIPEKQFIRLSLYDILGRRVKKIAEGVIEPGTYSYRLDSSKLSSGVYFLILQGEKERVCGKVQIMR